MSANVCRIGIALLTIAAATGCKEEALAPVPGTEHSDLTVQADVNKSPGDLAAIQQIVTTFDQAWTAGDAVTYAGQFAGVTEWVGPTGTVLTDPAAITARYTFLFTVALPGTIRQSTIRNLTFLTGTIAVLDIDTRVTGGTLPPAGSRAREKNILVKRAGEWQIIQHQQTPIN
jgi:uncharacterized protein (TIGR02246 family)